MSLDEWDREVQGWVKKYGVPSRVRSFNPTEVQACCRRCGKIRKRMSRHHIRNDMFFARLLPDVYAGRYIQFLAGDVVKLCNLCHKSAHEHIKPLVAECYGDLNSIGAKNVTQAWCEHWRSRFLTAYEEWLGAYHSRLEAKGKAKKNAKSVRRRKRGRKVHNRSVPRGKISGPGKDGSSAG